MPAAVSVRRFQSTDFESLVELLQEVLPSTAAWNTPRDALLRKLNRGDEMVWVAETGGVVVGTIQAGYDGVRGWIYGLAVHADQRHNGLGRRLLQTAETALTDLGCPKVNLQVRSGNSNALEFYHRCGYETEDRISLGKPLVSNVADSIQAKADSFADIDVTDDIRLTQIRWSDRPSYLKHLNETDEFHENTFGSNSCSGHS